MADKKYLDYEGLQELVAKIKENFARTGAFSFKGTVATVSGLPALTGTGHAEKGDVYMFTAEATTTADFIEGAGKPITQYDEVACMDSDGAGTLKWCILGPVFDVSDKLTYGSSLPASPADGDTFLYLGNTTYTYHAVSDPTGKNPQEEGWYVSDGSGGYVATSDSTPQSGTTYYTRSEQYVKGVIYVYNASGSEWVAQSSGDTMLAITTSEIDALFD